MADELTRVDTWLVARLKSDPTLVAKIGGAGNERIFSEKAPQGAAFPLVIFQFQGGHDVGGGTADSNRILLDGVWIVKGVAQQKSFGGDLATIADRVDAMLQGSSGGAAGSDGVVFAAVRESPFRLLEEENGIDYRHAGGSYRVWAQVP